MNGGAGIVIKENEYIRKFRAAGATDTMKARPLAELGIKPDAIFRRMEDKAIFLPGRKLDTFYMDQNAAEDFLATRRRSVFYVMLLLLAAALVLFFLVRR
jgi:hypothetical protein